MHVLHGAFRFDCGAGRAGQPFTGPKSLRPEWASLWMNDICCKRAGLWCLIRWWWWWWWWGGSDMGTINDPSISPRPTLPPFFLSSLSHMMDKVKESLKCTQRWMGAFWCWANGPRCAHVNDWLLNQKLAHTSMPAFECPLAWVCEKKIFREGNKM